MEKKYLYNKDTGMLHFSDGCYYGKHPTVHVQFFETEEEARQSSGGRIFYCRNCAKKKEKLLGGKVC